MRLTVGTLRQRSKWPEATGVYGGQTAKTGECSWRDGLRRSRLAHGWLGLVQLAVAPGLPHACLVHGLRELAGLVAGWRNTRVARAIGVGQSVSHGFIFGLDLRRCRLDWVEVASS